MHPVLEELGWMQTVAMYQTKFAQVAWNMEESRAAHRQDFQTQSRLGNYTFDISSLYDLVQDASKVIGVRGILFDVLSDDYDYYLYLPQKPRFPCTKSHGVGETCLEYETWWFYHYTGAILADQFLEDGSILWDGVTGQQFTDIADWLHAIQQVQTSPYVNQASFHAQHAIIWQYMAKTYPDQQEYPSELADQFCRYENGNRAPKFVALAVSKGIDHECYHG
jgi:hypothetical protein